MTTPTEDAWRQQCRLMRLSDTSEMRHAFYEGARYTFTRGLNSDFDEADLLALNEELFAFALAALATAE